MRKGGQSSMKEWVGPVGLSICIYENLGGTSTKWGLYRYSTRTCMRHPTFPLSGHQDLPDTEWVDITSYQIFWFWHEVWKYLRDTIIVSICRCCKALSSYRIEKENLSRTYNKKDSFYIIFLYLYCKWRYSLLHFINTNIKERNSSKGRRNNRGWVGIWHQA